MTDQEAAGRVLLSGLLQITVILGIVVIAGLVDDIFHDLFQRNQCLIIQHRIQLLQFLAHGDVSCIDLYLGLKHLFGRHEASHIHLRLFVLRNFLAGSQQLLMTSFHFCQSLLIVGINVCLLSLCFYGTVSIKFGAVRSDNGQQFRSGGNAGAEFRVGVFGPGLFLSFGNSFADGSHSSLFGLGLILRLLLGDVDIGFHNAFTGGIQKGLCPSFIQDRLSNFLILLGHIHRTDDNQDQTDNTQAGGNGSS